MSDDPKKVFSVNYSVFKATVCQTFMHGSLIVNMWCWATDHTLRYFAALAKAFLKMNVFNVCKLTEISVFCMSFVFIITLKYVLISFLIFFSFFVFFCRWSSLDQCSLISTESKWPNISPKTGRTFKTFRPGQMIYLLQHTQRQVSASE